MGIDIVYNMKREMLRRGLSRKTVKAYLFFVRKFLLFMKDKKPKEFSKKDVRAFLYSLHDRGLAGSSLNVAHNALRFMMIDILHKGMYLKIKFSKTPKKKPDYLTKDEIIKLLSVMQNKNHKLVVSLMYGAGLRVSETVKLKKSDLDFENLIGWVRNGKGGKDRPFIIPGCLKNSLLQTANKTNYYLFPGKKQTHLSVKSVQNIVKKAGKQAKLDRHVHPHMLRHSFTTHLLQSNEDVATVQSLLGHVHLETTLGYSHIAKPKLLKTKSPLDQLEPFSPQKVFGLDL